MRKDEPSKDRPNVINEYRTQNGYSVIEKFIRKQPENASEYFGYKFKLLREHGLTLGPCHVKPVRKGLWELKVEDPEDREYRVFFFVSRPGEFYLVHAIVKRVQRLPYREVKLALDRMREIQHTVQNEKRV